MTVSSDVRPLPGGVWTGRSPTPGSIVKPSLGGRGPSLAVQSVSWTTTSPRTALRTRTVRGGDGLLAGPPASSSPAGPHHSRRSLEVCRRYNEGRCRLPACRYLHTCTECRGDHPAIRHPVRPGPPAGPVPTSPDGPPGTGKLRMATPLMPQT